jgi:hypothetical protein
LHWSTLLPALKRALTSKIEPQEQDEPDRRLFSAPSAFSLFYWLLFFHFWVLGIITINNNKPAASDDQVLTDSAFQGRIEAT